MMMKKLLTAGLLGSTLLASAAMAQSTPAQPSSGATAPAGVNFMTRLEAGQMLASKIMDEDVVGADNKDIGDIEDLVLEDRKSTRLNSSHANISYAVFCLK